MSYSGVVRRILISCPGDVPDNDLAVIRQTINHWNGVYGESFGTAVLPISWGEHAAAQFGETPQGAINKQLVDKCDGCIAVFANRLGTATATTESGTVEEIERLAAAGMYVAILRSARQVDATNLDLSQAARLSKYLERISTSALVLKYSENAELARHVQNILAHLVSRDQARAEMQLQALDTLREFAEVWPRVNSDETVRTDSRGKIQTIRRWRLVLHNTGKALARNVAFSLDTDTWRVIRDVEDGSSSDVEILAPGSEAGFLMVVSFGSAQQTRCVVRWQDDRGPQENIATLRLN